MSGLGPTYIPAGGGGGGASVEGFTDGSILFAKNEEIAEDNANLFWDDTNDAMVVGDNDSSITLAGTTVQPDLKLQAVAATKPELVLLHEQNSAAFGATLIFAKGRSPGAVQDGDALGTFVAYGNDGTDYEQACDILLEVDGAVSDGEVPGRIRFRTQIEGGAFDDRLIIWSSGLVDVGEGTYSLATGDGDLGVDGDFEVNGQSRFDDEIGWRTTPETASAFVADYSDGTIVNFFRIDKTTTFSGADPQEGINILNFSLTEQSSTTAAKSRGARFRVAYDRSSHPTTNNIIAFEVVGYGPETNRQINSASSTFNWGGVRIDHIVPGAPLGNPNIDNGTFNLTDIETDKLDYNSWRNVNSTTQETLTHYSAKLGGKVLVEEDFVFSVGSSTTDGDRKAASIQLDPHYEDASGSSGFATWTISRHNYILIDDVSTVSNSSTVQVTDGCVFWFDAAAGTHVAVDSGSTHSSISTPEAWVKININGTVYYMPAYTSKT